MYDSGLFLYICIDSEVGAICTVVWALDLIKFSDSLLFFHQELSSFKPCGKQPLCRTKKKLEHILAGSKNKFRGYNHNYSQESGLTLLKKM